jgi:hypothetical protein
MGHFGSLSLTGEELLTQNLRRAHKANANMDAWRPYMGYGTVVATDQRSKAFTTFKCFFSGFMLAFYTRFLWVHVHDVFLSDKTLSRMTLLTTGGSRSTQSTAQCVVRDWTSIANMRVTCSCLTGWITAERTLGLYDGK